MFNLFTASDANELWDEAYQRFKTNFASAQGSRAGNTREIVHAAFCLQDPRRRWVTIRKPVLNLAFALAEIIWIVRGRNDAAFLNYFNSSLPKFAGCDDVYSGAYGYRLRRKFRIDQLNRAYQALSANSQSRQIVLQIWSPKDDLPDADGKPRNADIPCNISSILKVRNGRLDWLQIMRSNDLIRGFPYNIVQFTFLQEILAGWLEVELGEYHHISDSLHIYDSDFGHFESNPKTVSKCPAMLSLNKQLSELTFKRLERIALKIIDPQVTVDQLVSLELNNLPEAYSDIAIILLCEGMRRRKNRELALSKLKLCRNEIYTELYMEWLSRTK